MRLYRNYSPQGLLATRGQRRDEGHVLACGAELCCAAGGTQVVEEVCVGADVFAPLFGDVVFVVDCFYGADGLAGAAVGRTRQRLM